MWLTDQYEDLGLFTQRLRASIPLTYLQTDPVFLIWGAPRTEDTCPACTEHHLQPEKGVSPAHTSPRRGSRERRAHRDSPMTF